MTAVLQFKIACNGKRARGTCPNTLIVEADSVSYARKLAFQDDGWTAMQYKSTIFDYCPTCDPRKTSNGDIITFLTVRTNIRAITHMNHREKGRSRGPATAEKVALPDSRLR